MELRTTTAFEFSEHAARSVAVEGLTGPGERVVGAVRVHTSRLADHSGWGAQAMALVAPA